MRYLVNGLLLCIVLANATPVHSQWITHGPYGVSLGSILFLPQSPNIAIAAGADGYFRSTDTGRTWNRQFLMYAYVDCGYPIRSFPDNPNELLAVGDEVYRSTDEGLTWAYQAGSMSRDSLVCDMEIDPSKPSLVIAVTSDADVFRSTDRGTTWKVSNSGIQITPRERDTRSAPQVVFDPQHSTVYMMLQATRSIGAQTADATGSKSRKILPRT